MDFENIKYLKYGHTGKDKHILHWINIKYYQS